MTLQQILIAYSMDNQTQKESNNYQLTWEIVTNFFSNVKKTPIFVNNI
jgi:hypothetical protein